MPCQLLQVIIALLILLGFALVAAGCTGSISSAVATDHKLAGYVLKVGLEKGDKTPHELLIKPAEQTSRQSRQALLKPQRCVLILTAVVPKQLPIQTAMAVNTARCGKLGRVRVSSTSTFHPAGFDGPLPNWSLLH